VTTQDIVRGYSGRMRLKYEKAELSMISDGRLGKADKLLKSFIKAEKVNPFKKMPTKPRMIMARSPRFNLTLATYLHPLEAALWRNLKTTCPGVSKTRQVGKGLDAVQRASLIRRKREAIGEGVVVFEVDGSRFEAHVTREDLLREHSVYYAAYPGDNELNRLLNVQLQLKGTTACGVKFRREGSRASGDYNTGLGNTLIMLAACRAIMKVYSGSSVVRHDLLADGDNCLFFVEAGHAAHVMSRFQELAATVTAQEIVLERPVTVYEHCVFGQSKPVFNGKQYLMTRDPYKVLSQAFSGHRHYWEWRHGRKVMKAVAQCELYLALGIPVLQAYFLSACKAMKYVPDLANPSDFLEGRALEAVRLAGGWKPLRRAQPREVTDQARTSFMKAFGIGASEQRQLEDQLASGFRLPDGEWTFRDVYDWPEPEADSIADANFCSYRE